MPSSPWTTTSPPTSAGPPYSCPLSARRLRYAALRPGSSAARLPSSAARLPSPVPLISPSPRPLHHPPSTSPLPLAHSTSPPLPGPARVARLLAPHRDVGGARRASRGRGVSCTGRLPCLSPAPPSSPPIEGNGGPVPSMGGGEGGCLQGRLPGRIKGLNRRKGRGCGAFIVPRNVSACRAGKRRDKAAACHAGHVSILQVTCLQCKDLHASHVDVAPGPGGDSRPRTARSTCAVT